MWPRHTGDFTIFRVYTDPEGNPAKYDAKAADLINQFCTNFKRFKVSEAIVAAGPQLS
jgi:ATP-dependent phosphoenolpyruvate carboxykinase